MALHRERLSERHVAKRLQFSKRVVHSAIEKFKKHERKNDHAMCKVISTSTCHKLHANLLRKATDISISMVSHCLIKEFELKSYNQQ